MLLYTKGKIAIVEHFMIINSWEINVCPMPFDTLIAFVNTWQKWYFDALGNLCGYPRQTAQMSRIFLILWICLNLQSFILVPHPLRTRGPCYAESWICTCNSLQHHPMYTAWPIKLAHIVPSISTHINQSHPVTLTFSEGVFVRSS